MSVTDQVLADLPQVHTTMGADTGVWSTDAACYRFLESRVAAGARTLETGLGASTLLFALIGCHHTAVAPRSEEIAAFRTHCADRGIDLSRVTLIQGFSDEVLPSLEPAELDLYFIDGGHGFPTPILDWYFGASRLRRGGTLVIDDLQLPAVRMLTDVLDLDGAWEPLQRTPKWHAYERGGEGTLRTEWTRQTFLRPARPLWRRVAGRVRRSITARPGTPPGVR